VRVLVRAAGLALSLWLLSGCSQQAAATDDLIQALTESHSALASSVLGIQLYQQQRSTRAATETLLGDMARQITDAESALEPVKIDSPQLESDRDATLAAIHAGVAALLTSRDALEQRGSVDNTAALQDAGGQVDRLLTELRGSQ
jgi:hypothetical protein